MPELSKLHRELCEDEARFCKSLYRMVCTMTDRCGEIEHTDAVRHILMTVLQYVATDRSITEEPRSFRTAYKVLTAFGQTDKIVAYGKYQKECSLTLWGDNEQGLVTGVTAKGYHKNVDAETYVFNSFIIQDAVLALKPFAVDVRLIEDCF